MSNRYGFDVLGAQAKSGAAQRDIEQAGILADRAQFEEERDYPYKQLQYQKSLLDGLPIAARSYSYTQPSGLSALLGSTGDVSTLIKSLFNLGGGTPDSNTGTGLFDSAGSAIDTSSMSAEDLLKMYTGTGGGD